jgi:hypothetical protein
MDSPLRSAAEEAVKAAVETILRDLVSSKLNVPHPSTKKESIVEQGETSNLHTLSQKVDCPQMIDSENQAAVALLQMNAGSLKESLRPPLPEAATGDDHEIALGEGVLPSDWPALSTPAAAPDADPMANDGEPVPKPKSLRRVSYTGLLPADWQALSTPTVADWRALSTPAVAFLPYLRCNDILRCISRPSTGHIKNSSKQKAIEPSRDEPKDRNAGKERVLPSVVHARPPPAAAADDDTMANDGKRAAKPKSSRWRYGPYQLFVKVVNSVDIKDGLDPKVYGDKQLIDQMWNDMNQPPHKKKKRRVHRRNYNNSYVPFVERSRRCAAAWRSLKQTKEGRATRDYYWRTVSSC